MTRDEALEKVRDLQAKLERLRSEGESLEREPGALATEWEVFKNDAEMFSEQAFGKGSEDYHRIRETLYRHLVIVFGDEGADPPTIRFLEANYLDPLGIALRVVAHRLEEDHATLRGYETIRVPRWVYLAYTKAALVSRSITKSPEKAWRFAKRHSTAILLSAISGTIAIVLGTLALRLLQR